MLASIPGEMRRDDIQALLDVLNAAVDRSRGSTMDANEIWRSAYSVDNTFPSTAISFDDFQDAFSTLRSQNKKLKSIFGTLRVLTDSLEEANDRMGMRIESIAMHQGLARLPDELLSHILWHAASTFSEAIRLCAVCTRFRYTLLSSPEIWAKFPLTVSAAHAQIMAIVKRSGVVPLRARVEPMLYFPLNANNVLDHRARLQELTISPVNDPALYPQFVDIHLPILKRLCMKWSTYFRNEPQTHFDKSDIHVYETWSMPHLRFLQTNFVPRPLPGSNVVECELNLGEDSIYVKELLHFLSSSHTLENVKLSFTHTSAWRDSRPDPAVHLPNLRSLSINVMGRTSTSLLHRILSNLYCDAVSEVSFNMKASSWMEEKYDTAFGMDHGAMYAVEDVYLEGWSRSAIQFIQRQTSVRFLSVTIDEDQGKGDCMPLPPIEIEILRELLSNVPRNLETLQVSRCIVIRWDSKRQIECVRITHPSSYATKLVQAVGCVLGDSLVPERVHFDRCSQDREEFSALLTHPIAF